MMKLFVRLLAFVAVASCAVAQPNYWEALGGPYGGNVTRIVQDSSGALYALADNGIYRSNDNGTSWARRSEIPLGATFVSFAIARNGHYFASTANGGVYRSTDAGITWQNTSEGLPQSFAWAIAANPVADEVMVATGPGIYRTTDDGATWSLTGNERIARPVIFAPDGSALAVVDSGLMRSTDPARATWAWTDSAIAPSPITGMILIAPDTLWAGTEEHGVFRSTDLGATWQARNGTGLSSLAVMSIDQGLGEEVYVSTVDGGLHRSTDGGQAWVRINPGAPQFVSASTLRAASNRLFAASVKGLFYTDAHAIGVEWLPSRTGISNAVIRTVIAGDASDLFAAQFTGTVHHSTDNGATWSIVDLNIPPGTDVTALALDSAGMLYLAVRGVGLFQSSDKGATWARWGESLTTIRPTAIGIDSLTRIYVGSDVGTIYRSTDNGTTWDSTALGGGGGINAIAVRGETVYAGSQQNLYMSHAGGRDWAPTTTLIRSYSIAIAPNRDVYVGSFAGRVYRSSDDGMTWEYSVTTPVAPIIAAVGVNERGDLFAGAQPGGMFLSRDGARTWTPLQSGLLNPAITSISFNDAGVAYVGTYGGGVHRSVESTTGIAAEERAAGATMRVAPSPTASSAHVTLELMHARSVTLDLHDAAGARVASLYRGSLDAGSHRFDVDAEALSTGLYVVRAVIAGIPIHSTLVVAR
jgi:photosystem II stability/assembly factor-like uncharacterized protein